MSLQKSENKRYVEIVIMIIIRRGERKGTFNTEFTVGRTVKSSLEDECRLRCGLYCCGRDDK